MPSPIPWGLILHSDAATEGNWLFAGAMQRAALRACRDAWKSSTRRVTRCWRWRANIPLVQGLAALGRCAEGIALVNRKLSDRSRQTEAFLTLPELLRVKGSVLLAMPQPIE